MKTKTSRKIEKKIDLIPGVHLDVHQLVLLQRQSSNLSNQSNQQVSAAQAGSYRSRFRGRGMDFDEVRHYQPGDDIRNIDWRVTARTQKVHTKLFREERERPTFVCLDLCLPMYFSSQNTLKSVLSCTTAAMLIWQALGRRDRIGSVLFNEAEHFYSKPSSSTKAAMSLFKRITEMHNTQVEALKKQVLPASKDNVLNENLSRLRNVIHPGSLIYISSDFSRFDADTERHLSLLAKHNEVVAIQILDPLDLALPPPGRYPITNGQQVSEFVVESEAMRQTYAAKKSQRLERLKDTLLKFKIHYHQFLTGSDYGEKMLTFLLQHPPRVNDK